MRPRGRRARERQARARQARPRQARDRQVQDGRATRTPPSARVPAAVCATARAAAAPTTASVRRTAAATGVSAAGVLVGGGLVAAVLVAAAPAPASAAPLGKTELPPVPSVTVVSDVAGGPAVLGHDDALGWYWQVRLRGVDGYVASWERTRGLWAGPDQARLAITAETHCEREVIGDYADRYVSERSFEKAVAWDHATGRITDRKLSADLDACDDAVGWDWSRTPSTRASDGTQTVRIPLSVVGPGRHALFVAPESDFRPLFTHEWDDGSSASWHVEEHVIGAPVTFTVDVPRPPDLVVPRAAAGVVPVGRAGADPVVGAAGSESAADSSGAAGPVGADSSGAAGPLRAGSSGAAGPLGATSSAEPAPSGATASAAAPGAPRPTPSPNGAPAVAAASPTVEAVLGRWWSVATAAGMAVAAGTVAVALVRRRRRGARPATTVA